MPATTECDCVKVRDVLNRIFVLWSRRSPRYVGLRDTFQA